MPSQSVLVIGGGLAGLSSAIALAEAGFRVQLLEKRPHLGGRATSYTLPDGSEVDNCQHVTLGCCTNLADFYRRVGASGRFVFTTGCILWIARGGVRNSGFAAAAAAAHGAVVFVFRRADAGGQAFDCRSDAGDRARPEGSRRTRMAHRCWTGCTRCARRQVQSSDSGAWCW